MPTEKCRSDSLERYQPPKNRTQNEDDINKQMENLNINKEKASKNNRRSINGHLFGNSSNFGSTRGRGRGRGRSNDRNKSFDQPQPFSNQDIKRNRNINERWKSDLYNEDEQEPQQRHQYVFNDEQVERNAQFQHHRNNKFTPKKKNTETFKPSHKPADMRILTAHAGWKRYTREMESRDVLLVYDVFCSPDDLTIYNNLLREIKTSGIDQENIWQLWHGDSHVIADDKQRWKDSCPTFHMVLDKIRDYFQMDIKATRLNWYRSSEEWKPFHHDAAAIKPDKAKTQNLTVGVSFGAERDAAFEHATTKTVISMPQPNGTIYTFGKDVNVIWRHGILQVPPEKYHDRGRISIIAWGWAEQTPV